MISLILVMLNPMIVNIMMLNYVQKSCRVFIKNITL